MTDIANKLVVLKLNKNWMPCGMSIVSKALVDLCAGEACMAIDIDYARDNENNPIFNNPINMRPVNWDEWITLPVREWDLKINSPSITIRVPTVIIAKNYSKMPIFNFRGKPNKRQIFKRDNGVDQYTGKKLKDDDATIDHVIPKSKGGHSTWNNLVLTHKHLNWKKGNRLNEEVGLHLIKIPKAPAPVPAYALIKEARHIDWKHFLQ
jgi:5-methylcytosine-specific restriction endonuclease McrA